MLSLLAGTIGLAKNSVGYFITWKNPKEILANPIQRDTQETDPSPASIPLLFLNPDPVQLPRLVRHSAPYPGQGEQERETTAFWGRRYFRQNSQERHEGISQSKGPKVRRRVKVSFLPGWSVVYAIPISRLHPPWEFPELGILSVCPSLPLPSRCLLSSCVNEVSAKSHLKARITSS